MPEIEAAIGIEQLKKLPTFVEKRRRNAEALTEKLSGVKQLVLPSEPRGCISSWYLYTVRIRNGTVKDRDIAIQNLRKKGVGAGVYYHTPIHLMPYYRQHEDHVLPETEKAAEQVFSLPVHPGLKATEVNYVARAVRQIMR
jgi:dTDP-4-amino-4,6-dideoxygalactose transaminase